MNQQLHSWEGSEGVLVSGGTDGFNTHPRAEYGNELYSMFESRQLNKSHKLENDDVIVIEGWDGGSVNHASTEIFDVSALEFMAGPTMEVGRSNHRSVVLNDSRILVSGGFDGTTNATSCEIYEPVSNTFSPAATMNYERSSHTISLLDDGRVLVTGGFNPDLGFEMNQCEIYNPFTNQWSEVAAMNQTLDNHAAAVAGNRIYVGGGRYFNSKNNWFEGITTVEYYSVANDTWVIDGQTLGRHSYHAMYEVPHGSIEYYKLIIPGGADHTGAGVDLTYSTSESLIV